MISVIGWSDFRLQEPIFAFASVAHSTSAGLTAGEATIIASSCTAIAVLTVGVLNVLTQRQQIGQQERHASRQLHEQRQLLGRQLDSQREQASQQLSAQREQIDKQLAEQRELQLNATKGDAAKLMRAERKAAYTKVLAQCRSVQGIWQQVAYQPLPTLLAGLSQIQATLVEKSTVMEMAMAEIELIGSVESANLLGQFTIRTGQLLAILINTSESAIERQGAPTPATFAEAQTAVRNELERNEILNAYVEMQTTMRLEMLGEGTGI